MKDLLKKLRAEKGSSQQDVADFLEINRVSYARFEGGNSEPSKDTLVKLANYFNCTTDYLLGRTDRPELVLWDNLPEELRKAGIEAIEIAKIALEEGLTAEDIKDIIELAKKLEKSEK